MKWSMVSAPVFGRCVFYHCCSLGNYQRRTFENCLMWCIVSCPIYISFDSLCLHPESHSPRYNRNGWLYSCLLQSHKRVWSENVFVFSCFEAVECESSQIICAFCFPAEYFTDFVYCFCVHLYSYYLFLLMHLLHAATLNHSLTHTHIHTHTSGVSVSQWQ